MRLYRTVAALRCYLEQQRCRGESKDNELKGHKSIGLVPTMGGLHAGHLSLIERARRENDICVVSIFVNPLQFAPTEDLQQYPRNLEGDQQLCAQAGVDVIFAPTAVEMEVENGIAIAVVPPEYMIKRLCGLSRSSHFQGVATIVTKLFNIVKPQRAYFGQKDAQQLAIIRRLVADLNLELSVVACPIVREESGLAYSSRNQYLTASEKEVASVLYRGLQQAERLFKGKERSRQVLLSAFQSIVAVEKQVQLEYVDLVDPDTLSPLDKIEDKGLLACAALVGSTRLIDNIVLGVRQPIVAIDGPAGAGKSTVARLVAEGLGLLYLDTGAMYRAVTWLVLRSGIDVTYEPEVAELVSNCQIQLTPTEVWIDSHNVTQEIRSREVTSHVSAIAAQKTVRRVMVKEQQRWGEKGGIVVEGRDIGTNVFPDAALKIFLTASVGERARRRQQDLAKQAADNISLEQLEKEIGDRDLFDSSRSIAPLRKAVDAIEIQTDNLSINEVTERIISLYRQKVTPQSVA
ncbi:MAG: bifunctional pantoate--beta-alanine ligase/(d)CMP kinase [Hormoscilla sp. GM102CHS1]|nr:bifunctional pantoate--beta-alanine ligase/(d)CMP kinase [Hormoscilla sp. GM102CHS1]